MHVPIVPQLYPEHSSLIHIHSAEASNKSENGGVTDITELLLSFRI